MGLDGGTYITRSDVLRGQSWDMATADTSRSTRGGTVSSTLRTKQLDPQRAREAKWTTCTLTGQPLQPPISADYLGNLYNREAVIEFLLGKNGSFADDQAEHRYLNQLREGGAAFDHLQSLRDVFAVHLDASKQARKPTAAAQEAVSCAPYLCPVTDLPCTRYPFAALPGCGHVFSSRAIAQMSDHLCAICAQPFAAAETLILNGSEQQVQNLREAVEERRLRKKREKLGKKRKSKSEADASANVFDSV